MAAGKEEIIIIIIINMALQLPVYICTCTIKNWLAYSSNEFRSVITGVLFPEQGIVLDFIMGK